MSPPAASEPQLPLTSGATRVGTLTIRQLPSSTAPVVNRAHAHDRVDAEPAVALREASAYRYEIDADWEIAAIEPAELFDPDDDTLRAGRLLTREAVGVVRIEIARADARDAARALVDVRPHKLADEQAFRRMLADLAELGVDVLHRAFAPSAGRFTSSAETPRMLYQRFALLHQQLFADQLEWALARILAEPYRAWTTDVQERPPGTPIKGSSRLARSLTRAGPRVVARGMSSAGTLPRRIPVDRTESTLDNQPNRYVRFVLERWRSIAADVLDAVPALGSAAARRRGAIAAQRTLDRLDELLSQPLLREVGELRSFPQGNQVLIKRDGYRQLAGAAALVESSLDLDLGIDDPLLVSQRSVADLYELWCFARLARAVGAACEEERIVDLFEMTEHGMVLTLRRGATSLLHHEPEVAGRRLEVDLYFHRRFRGTETWTRELRPDCSLVVRPAGAAVGFHPAERSLHFDAKYRLIDGDPFAAPPADPDDERDRRRSKVVDLLKMHAYRDAIRRSAAAYVLYPGDEATLHHYADEPLPAIGAFPLRPDAADGDGQALERFVAGVLRHVANQASREERATFWQARAYRGRADDRAAPPAAFLDRPPADTGVLLGYVRNWDHWRWIVATGMYNVRGDGDAGGRRGRVQADSPVLDAPLLLLYGGALGAAPRLYLRASGWSAVDRGGMRQLRYPEPIGPAYFCCEIEPIASPPSWLSEIDPRALLPSGGRFRGPAATTWLDLLLARRDVG